MFSKITSKIKLLLSTFRKEPAKVPADEAEYEPIVFEDQPAYDIEPLPDLPDESKKLKINNKRTKRLEPRHNYLQFYHCCQHSFAQNHGHWRFFRQKTSIYRQCI